MPRRRVDRPVTGVEEEPGGVGPGASSAWAWQLPGRLRSRQVSPGAVTVPVSKLPNYRLALYRLIYFFRLAYASSTSSLFVNLTALLDRGVSSFLARIVEQPKLICLFFLQGANFLIRKRTLVLILKLIQSVHTSLKWQSAVE